MALETWLVLVPTRQEFQSVRQHPAWSEILQNNNPQNLSSTATTPLLSYAEKALPKVELGDVVFEICGFGLVSAAARTAELIARYQPDRVLLIGIAGVYADGRKIGTASAFGSVACWGIGVGEGANHSSMSEMGWQHWSGCDSDLVIDDEIELAAIGGKSHHVGEPLCDKSGRGRALLLSVTSAAASQLEAEARLQKYPRALGEDMEGFAVAAACKLAGVSCHIVRGFSNLVGDRDKSSWKFEQALDEAARISAQLIRSSL
jgi:futalosine hydrolase